jgi:hypothetical protein
VLRNKRWHNNKGERVNLNQFKMRKRTLVILSLFILCIAVQVKAIDKKHYYHALASGSEPLIDEVLLLLKKEKQSSATFAYQGAMLMKKAGFVKGVKGKVDTFKKGAALLEKEIQQNGNNTEYRFLRLTVQEHAPGILKYNKDIEEDKKVILNNYSKLDSTLKEVITNYAQDSKILSGAELTGK